MFQYHTKTPHEVISKYWWHYFVILAILLTMFSIATYYYNQLRLNAIKASLETSRANMYMAMSISLLRHQTWPTLQKLEEGLTGNVIKSPNNDGIVLVMEYTNYLFPTYQDKFCKIQTKTEATQVQCIGTPKITKPIYPETEQTFFEKYLPRLKQYQKVIERIFK